MVKLPSKTCVLCNHSPDQIGGRRILAKKTQGNSPFGQASGRWELLPVPRLWIADKLFNGE